MTQIIVQHFVLLVTAVIFHEISSSADQQHIPKIQIFNKPKSTELRSAASKWPDNRVISSGREFIMAFPNSHQNINDTFYTEKLMLIINNPSSSSIARITVSSIFPGFSTRHVNITAKETIIIDIDPVSIQTAYGDQDVNNVMTEQKGILIRSTSAVQIVATNEHSDAGSGDAFTLLPTCQLGMSYITINDEAPLLTTRIYTIVATQDNTNVTYGATGMIPASRWVMLNRLQTHTYTTNEYYVTGSTITANKPISVFSGTVCGFGWLFNGACDYMMAQMEDTTSWGSTFGFVTMAYTTATEYTLVAKADNTRINLGDTDFITLNSDQYLRLYQPTALVISSLPVEVMQVGSQINSTYGDPFYVPVLPENQFINVVVQFMTAFSTQDQASFVHFLRITTVVSSIGMISVDDTSIPEPLYTQIGSSHLYYYETQISSGVHNVAPLNSNVRYSAVVYGYGRDVGYGFVAGIDLPGSYNRKSCLIVNQL